MPIHDWTRVKAGIFHDFHHEWISTIKYAINRNLKGTRYYALAEQIAGDFGPDVLTLQAPERNGTKQLNRLRSQEVSRNQANAPGVAVAESPPKVRFRFANEQKWYAAKKKAVTIRHVSEHNLVAVLEILSPGNKSTRDALTAFAQKAHNLLAAGVHFSVVDLFPPTRRDPKGIHPILWSDEDDDTFQFDPRKPLTCASYVSAPLPEAFVEPVGMGDKLPDLPVFLTPQRYVPVPLEVTYQAAFEAVPQFWREALVEGAKVTTPSKSKK
jgi:hypothetical protein